MSLRHSKAYQFASSLATGREVLEIGCGAGNGAVYLACFARQIIAVDVEPRLIELMPLVWPATEVCWQTCDALRLPFSDRSFDLVVSFQTIEHVLDPHRFCSEAMRVLRPGGILLITTPNRTLRVAPGQRPWNPYHVREFYPWELRRLLHKVGLREGKMWGLHAEPEVARSERSRTLRQLLGHYWMRLPTIVRRNLKRLPGGRDLSSNSFERHKGLTNSQATADALHRDVYRWERGRLVWSLDLLASGVR